MTFVTGKITSPTTGFGALDVTERTPIVELKSNYGISARREVTTVAGTGAVTNADGEYTLSTGATTGSSAQLESGERGRYQPGAQAQCGIGIRLSSAEYAGTAEARWGYFDTEDGFGFGVNATGPFVFTRRASTDADVQQSSWNRDTLDGNGPSGLTLDLQEGNIFQIDFSWYGYGVIQFKVVTTDANGSQTTVIVHEFSPTQQTSVKDPNLPVNAVVNNGDTTTDYDIYVGGRQFSVFSKYNPNRRINGDRRLSLGSVGTTFVPLISFRRKSAFDSVSVKVQGVDIITDADLVWEVRTGVTAANLTGESFGTPTNTSASETACESDTSASAIAASSGEFVTGGLIDASGSGATSSGAISVDGLEEDVIGTQIVTLQVRTISGTATVSGFLRWKEEW